MPIRLLKFDQDGGGITLVDRSHVIECISAELNSLPYYGKSQFEKYAILSHAWLSAGEITYSDWTNRTLPLDTKSPGYDKLAKFCKVASTYGCSLGWMDTVCINKQSSTELDESIRSMFKLYQEAKICIVYLAETASLEGMEKDKWFTRGWTLQELLTPECINFYSKNWTPLVSDNPADHFNKFLRGLISKICDWIGKRRID